ncbi:MAG: reverse transcriptase family protein [Candidatus Thiodiazotropha sp.]
MQPRKQFLRKSGGISIFFKEKLSKYISKVESDSDYVLWIEIQRDLLNLDENLIIGVLYVPPENSDYFNDDELTLLETEITSFCNTHKYVTLTGDFNARTSEMRDYTENDDFLADMFDFDTDTVEYFTVINKLVESNILKDRISMDKHTNNNGYKLIDICKNHNLFILNGRIDKDRAIGNFTFRNASVIDYTIATADCFELFQEFEIIETDTIFSDGHSILSHSLIGRDSCCFLNSQYRFDRPKSGTSRPRWNVKHSDSFRSNIDREQLNLVLDFLGSETPSKLSVNEATERIASVFSIASDKTFPIPGKFRVNSKRPWFGPVCKSARKKYHLAKKQYNIRKTPRNKELLNEHSRSYKRTMNNFIAKHRKLHEKKLRNLHSKNPKEYWKFINSLKTQTKHTSPGLDEFCDFFKNLNSSEDEDTELPNLNFDINNEILNATITQDEILRCINNLNNGKTSGLDKILNEYIKTTKDIFLPIYEKLFNIILDTGFFPEQWSIGSIKPIYKNKGDPLDPRNYRPITILSCLGKLFTSILNKRLNKYLEDYLLLSENQAGFRKQYSTMDHIFSLHALIEILKSQKKKLFCCFVDFSSAFDSVWRMGLWRKLLNYNIDGKLFRVIFNMYNDIKSCVSLIGENSAFSPSLSGVRQGENLSPILFSLYLNDLESYLLQNFCSGIDFNIEDLDIVFYLRLVVLLYADDTVILANSEQDLQHSINVFQNYCTTWKLKVNINKTKVVIFGAKKTDLFRFTIDNSNIEITDKYKYLGVFFSQSRSFLNARKHIAEQAKKAMYLLFCRINNLELPIDLQLKLFDHTILPILTYASEIWGFESIDVLEKIHIEFLRKITKCRKSTPLYMLYAELGRVPLNVIVKSRIIGFWNRLLLGKETKIAKILYYVLINTENITSKWIVNVKKILCDVGRNDLWVYQNYITSFSTKFLVKQLLKDQYLQNWRANLNVSSKANHYGYIKDNIELEPYFKLLPKHLYLNMVLFRTANHKFPIEVGRWNNIELEDRKCTLCCKNTIGDEFHYLLECPFFNNERLKYVSSFYYRRPNMLKYKELLSRQNVNHLRNLAVFMGIIIKYFRFN